MMSTFYADLDFYSISSLKQQSVARYVTPLGHIILIPSLPAFFESLILQRRRLKQRQRLITQDGMQKGDMCPLRLNINQSTNQSIKRIIDSKCMKK